MAGAEAEEEDEEVEDEDRGHGLASSFAAAAACGLDRGGGDRRRSSRRSARVDGIALRGRFPTLLLGRCLGFWSAAAGAFP